MILGVLQARVSSARLPGKVLQPVLGVPMILLQVERLRRSGRLDDLVLATSTDTSDDELAEVCAGDGIGVVRGSLDDVLDRFHAVLGSHPAEHVVRLTGDCPLADWELIDRVVDHHLDGGFDYTSSAIEPTFPDGLDVEAVRASCLEVAWSEATAPSDREHVTRFIYMRPERFHIGSVRGPVDLSDLRWTVDDPADLEFVREVYRELYPAEPAFRTEDVLALLERRPELKAINAGIARNEGLARSLAQEAAHTAEAGSRDDV